MRTEIEHMKEALASYIEATDHLSNSQVVNLRRELLISGGVAQIPYIESTPVYIGEREFSSLELPASVRELLTSLASSRESGELLFNPPYKHQADALEITMNSAPSGGSGIVVTTGTGSGKTESFLLPILARLAEEASKRRSHFSQRAVRALLLYPMNALVNDQLGRLRTLFGSSAVRRWFTDAADRPAKFGRYTSRTLYPGMRSGDRDQTRLRTLEYYLKIEDGARDGDIEQRALVETLQKKGRWPAKPDSSSDAFDGLRNWYGQAGQHWEDANGAPQRACERPEDAELLIRHEIQSACPDLLVTNYSMLEYMLLRPIERKIFSDTRIYFEEHPDEKFFLILDEAHLYRGANGTEVAYLIRRLLDRLGLPPSRVVFIATSASFSNPEAAKPFVSGLTGLAEQALTTLTGEKRAFEPAGKGSDELASALAAVPLGALQSPSPRARSAVLAPLASHAQRSHAQRALGAPIKLESIDSNASVVTVTVYGLDPNGARVEEEVQVPSEGTVQTGQSFLIVDEVRCQDGRVNFARAYELGIANAEDCDWKNDDLPAALDAVLNRLPVIGRLRNITSGATSRTDPIVSPGDAWALTRLPEVLFPTADTETAVAAVDALLELASLAKPMPAAPPMLPARVHMLFRGLPGLWACANPQCTEISQQERGGPTGALYAEPRQNCKCGAQVYELHSCRSCGLAVACASVGSPAGVEHLWQDNGRAYAGDNDVIQPIHVCFEDPMPQIADRVRTVFLDLSSGRIDGSGSFLRDVWLPPLMGDKLFDRCPRCGTQGSISDLQTRGEQPFQELISVQVLEQPPRPEVDTPLQGRKALVFSDGRQTASRLAGTLKTFSFRDSLRPLLLTGIADLQHPTYRPSLDDAPLAVALGAAKHGVRLRPVGDDQGTMNNFGMQAKALLENEDAENNDFRFLTDQTSAAAPLSVFQSLYAVLQDNHTGLFPLALAMLRPKLTRTEQRRLDELVLPMIAGMGEEEVRNALVELWLWQAMRKHAIKLQHTPANVENAGGASGIRQWDGRFSGVLTGLLEARGLGDWLRGDYMTICGPLLRSVFSQGEIGAFYVHASRVMLDAGDTAEWIRCKRCTRVSPRNPLLADRCDDCGGTARLIDPAQDAVFRSRKSFYRRLWERLSDPQDAYAPHMLIAEEHSAALNDSRLANEMSRNEAYELCFQDIPIPIQQDGQTRSPIDILSCTTTMEVGIDIGGLTAVALRNVPPGRANYQQRAGRAGRRGAGLSTVVMFCGADSHDQSFFRDPAPIVAGPSPDPILNLDNPVIAERQAFAYLIGRFQQDRIDAVGGNADLFSSLGTVADFMGGDADVFSLAGLKQWITVERDDLEKTLECLFAASCPTLDAKTLLDRFPAVLGGHLNQDDDDVGDEVAEDNVDDEVAEDSVDDDHSVVDNGKLLNRLFAEGLLPKYAFPTDVATFSVFEAEANPWRPRRRYSPQLNLNVALSQYAPGHEVWVDGQRYLSLGLYSERDEDRIAAYGERRLYFQCRVCNYADLKDLQDGYPEQTRDCPACNGRATLGPARRWVRPTGFSHPPSIGANPPDFNPDISLRPTRATLDALRFAPEARIGGENWPIGSGWEGFTDNQNLVVTNRGSLSAIDYGFNYCSRCGRIEPAKFDSPMRQLRGGQTHLRPRPNRPQEPEGCDGTPIKIVLGNEFKTDVAVFRLALPISWQLDPDRNSTTIAARSAVEALRRAACMLEDLEPNDIDGYFRFAPPNATSQFIDLYLYDQAVGGAGFVKTAAREPQRLVDKALQILDNCDCDDACYQCLRSYKNRFEHDLFDRRIGADLLRAAFKGRQLAIDPVREEFALDRLETDLRESGAPAVTRVDGGLIDHDTGRVICLAHPFLPTTPCSERAHKVVAGRNSVAVDILLVLRALPIATNQALPAHNVDPSADLIESDLNGVPELTADRAAADDVTPTANAPRFSVAEAEAGDFLFRLDANTLSGPRGDGNNEVPRGTMCLFRPHDGPTANTDIYLIRRTDGKAFGATGEAWTVGLLQPLEKGRMRVRYRAASHFMECASELVQPSDALVAIARFVRAVC